MSLSALGLRRKDDRKFAATTITAIGAEKKLSVKLWLDYLKLFIKIISSFLRNKFLKKCLDYDIIPDFLRFPMTESSVFRIEPCAASN